MYVCNCDECEHKLFSPLQLFLQPCSRVGRQAGSWDGQTIKSVTQSEIYKVFSFCIFYIHFNIECKYLSQILHFFAGATHTISAYTTTAAAIIHISCGRRVVRELCTHVLISRNAFKFIYKLIKQQLQRYIHTHGFF